MQHSVCWRGFRRKCAMPAEHDKADAMTLRSLRGHENPECLECWRFPETVKMPKLLQKFALSKQSCPTNPRRACSHKPMSWRWKPAHSSFWGTSPGVNSVGAPAGSRTGGRSPGSGGKSGRPEHRCGMGAPRSALYRSCSCSGAALVLH